MIPNLLHNRYFLLAAIIVLYISVWIGLRPVYPDSDNYWYTYHAVNLLSGNFHLAHNEFQDRLGVTAPAGLFIYLFGINPYSISLWPLIAGLLTVIFVFFITGKYAGTAVGAVASILIASNILQASYSISLFPDVIIAFYITLIVLLVFRGRVNTSAPSFFYPAAISILTALAFLTKETILFLFPFMALVCITDVVKKEHKYFWRNTLLSFLSVALTVLLFYYLLTGNPFYRFTSAFGFIANDMAYPALINKFTALYHHNFLLWFDQCLGYIFIFLFALPVLLSFRKINLSDYKHYILTYTLFLLCEYIIAINIPRYGLVFFQDRIWMPLVAPLSILSAYFITEGKRKDILIVSLPLLLLIPLNYYITDAKRALLFGIFFVAVTTSGYLKLSKPLKTLLLVSPFILLLCYFIYTNSNYRSDVKKVESFNMHSHDK